MAGRSKQTARAPQAKVQKAALVEKKKAKKRARETQVKIEFETLFSLRARDREILERVFG